MHKPRVVRRAVAVALVLSVGVVPFLSSSSVARGDEIGDLQSRADKISSQISDLQQQVVQDTAAVEHASYKASQIDAKIDSAAKQLAAAKKQERSSRRALSQYALNAYVNGGSGSVDLATLLDTDAGQIGPRQGYESTAVGDRQELVDQLQASQRVTSERAAALKGARAQAAAVAAKARDSRDSAEAAQQQLESIQSQLKGKLAKLVAEKQAAAQRAAEARARAAAQAAQRKAQAQAAASQAAAQQAAAPTPAAPAPAPTPQTAPAPSAQVSSPSSAPSGSGGGARAVAAAQSQLGVPYVWGGSTPAGFDCSGLMMWAWAQAGVSIPRVTYAQRGAGQVVPLSAAQPGDLIFYNGFSHVAMYVGGGQVIHAPHTGDVVRYASMYMDGGPILVVRP